jgi:hypothetical protein
MKRKLNIDEKVPDIYQPPKKRMKCMMKENSDKIKKNIKNEFEHLDLLKGEKLEEIEEKLQRKIKKIEDEDEIKRDEMLINQFKEKKIDFYITDKINDNTKQDYKVTKFYIEITFVLSKSVFSTFFDECDVSLWEHDFTLGTYVYMETQIL